MSTFENAEPLGSGKTIDPRTIEIEPARSVSAAPEQTVSANNVVPFPATDALEGGEGGKVGAPEIPPSPPFPPSSQRADERTTTTAESPHATGRGDVYIPAPPTNPVLMLLRECGLYVRQSAQGQHEVRCPWGHEHDANDVRLATYKEPSAHRSIGVFSCPHPHAEAPHIGNLLDRLGLSASDARAKPIIRMVPGEMLAVIHAAETALVRIGGYYQSGGVIVTVHTSEFGDPVVSVLTEHALTKALALSADWYRFDSTKKKWRRTDPVQTFVKLLHNAQLYEVLPFLDGIARQPYFRKADGAFITKPGYDPASRVLGVFERTQFPTTTASEEAARKALAELKSLLSEFPFASPADMSAALCGMLTAAVRSSLPLSPAFNITASTSGSGKSYLAKLFGLFAGPGEPLSLSYPVTSDEATKAMLAAFMSKPAVISFDDMQTDWIPHGMINRMLTSETVGGRVLGESRTIQVSTNAFIMGTGNNVGPIRDTSRRVLTIDIRPQISAPATQRFRDRPVEKVASARGGYVTLALTIIRAWQSAGRPKSDLPDIATFEAWSDMCRHPLVWLGEPDPATSLIEQVRADPDAELLGRFMFEWRQALGDKAVTLRQLVDESEKIGRRDLSDAISDLPVVEHGKLNRSKLGWYLKKQAHRIVSGMFIRKEENSERNAWSVAVIDPAAMPPPRPPEPEPELAATWLRKPLPNGGADPGEVF